MNRQTICNTNTDCAWNLLYSRLQQEGLVAPEKKRTFRQRLRLSVRAGIAAAVLMLCIGAGVVAFLHQGSAEADSHLLSLHNGEGSATLVTTLEDGSIVYLANNARLQYPEHFLPGRREVILSGRAMFDVQGHRDRPFLITTGIARIEVTGTTFDMQSDHRHFELSVRQGEVKVTLTKNGHYLYASAGETVTLSPSGHLQAAQTANAGRFDRYSRHIRFKDEKLGNILRVINHRSTDTVLQTTPSLEGRQITVTFAGDAPESVAELICIAFNLIYKKKDNILLISEP
jgi:ferric-dicitrate binding protein FerR (iron transport regulator)